METDDRRFQDNPASCSCSELALRQETHKAEFSLAGPLAILIPCGIAKPMPIQISTLVLTSCSLTAETRYATLAQGKQTLMCLRES